jgi:hypothetical protein
MGYGCSGTENHRGLDLYQRIKSGNVDGQIRYGDMGFEKMRRGTLDNIVWLYRVLFSTGEHIAFPFKFTVERTKQKTYQEVAAEHEDEEDWFKKMWQGTLENIVWPVSPQRQHRLGKVCSDLTVCFRTINPTAIVEDDRCFDEPMSCIALAG